MSDSPESVFLHAIANVPSVLGLNKVPVWSLCAGTGIMHHCMGAISGVLRNQYGVDICFDTVLIAELDRRNREH
eukprot:1673055-Pyramimonas_sp.AAC.1